MDKRTKSIIGLKDKTLQYFLGITVMFEREPCFQNDIDLGTVLWLCTSQDYCLYTQGTRCQTYGLPWGIGYDLHVRKTMVFSSFSSYFGQRRRWHLIKICKYYQMNTVLEICYMDFGRPVAENLNVSGKASRRQLLLSICWQRGGMFFPKGSSGGREMQAEKLTRSQPQGNTGLCVSCKGS